MLSDTKAKTKQKKRITEKKKKYSLVFHHISSAVSCCGRQQTTCTSPAPKRCSTRRAGGTRWQGPKDFGVIAGSNDTQCMHLWVVGYHVSLRGGVDALVFAGGIGERSARLRGAVVDGLESLGFVLV
jgi:acetate kinase